MAYLLGIKHVFVKMSPSQWFLNFKNLKITFMQTDQILFHFNVLEEIIKYRGGL